MEVTLVFDCGLLGDLEITTDTRHGSPDVAYLGDRDISNNGPMIDAIMILLGDEYPRRLRMAEDLMRQADGMREAKAQRELEQETKARGA